MYVQVHIINIVNYDAAYIVQVDLKSSESVTASLHQEMKHLERELVTERGNTKSLTADLLELKSKYEELDKQLHETQQEV